MNRILLYAPEVVGHPRVYCRVIADALADTGCELFVAMGFSETAGLEQSPDVQPLAARERVRLLDTRELSAAGEPHLKAEDLVALQRKFSIDTTLFIEADKFAGEFVRIAEGAAPRLLRRNLGIFAATSDWYPGEDSYTGEPLRILAPTVRRTLGNIKRLILQGKQSRRNFFEKIVIGTKVLDEILTKDERLAEWHGPPVYWMPEISRPAPVPESPADAEEFNRQESALREFMRANAGKEPVLYFGDAAYYKGYDLFLRFAANTPSVCAVHAGQSYDRRQLAYFQHDVEALRCQLRAEGRLFETNAYVHTERLKRLYFDCVRLYITTHRLALSSSTVIQALELGKPVLVPNRGLLGHRVRAHGLGDVYEYGDLSELGQKAALLWRSDLARFTAPALAFWRRFSDESIRRFFVERLLTL